MSPRSSLPSRPGAYVERRRLLKVAVCPAGGLLLLCAPAGYGKSLAALALAEEALARGERLLWIGLEEGDAELPGRLAADPARRHPGEPSLLVLDGVHALGAGGAAALLEKLARGRHAAARLVATTRERLRPGLEGLRAAGLLRELGPEILAFDEEEARAVLAASLGFQPPRQALSSLVRTTRGWPACLRLAAAAARSPRELEALVRGLDGEVAAVADYLADRVLGGLDPAWRAFLRVAALPEAIDAELLEALGAGRALPAGSAAELLAEAERRNLLEALDPRRRRYAMHSLLRERLLAEAGREEPAALAELRLLASRRLEERGEVEAAVALAVEAGDSERAGALIRASLSLLYGRNATLAVASWLRRLPRRRVEADPELGLLEAWTLAILGDFDRALGLLDSLAGPGPRGRPAFGPGVLEAVRVYAERFRTPRVAAGLGLRLLGPPASGGTSNEWIRGLLGVSTGDALLSLGELEDAETRLRAALPPLLARGQRSSSLSCLHRLCRLALHRGDPAEVRSLLARMGDLAAEDPALLSGGVVETDRAALALLEGRVAEARSLLAEAEEAVEYEGSYSYRFDYLALRVRVLAAAGEGAAARESLEALEALVGRAGSK
ncbi:MAG: hypothetical protein JNG85_15035, partial [Spirochaetaceae bacterium]|nr:hypothetical protein [Spirochaetaceae bacterium]